jgi:hypothetical protein
MAELAGDEFLGLSFVPGRAVGDVAHHFWLGGDGVEGAPVVGLPGFEADAGGFYRWSHEIESEECPQGLKPILHSSDFSLD